MNNPFINTLPLLIAEEKPALMESILNLLREKGFVIIKKDSDIDDEIHFAETKKMDGLNMLRYIIQYWPKWAPVVIVEENTNELNRSLLAA